MLVSIFNVANLESSMLIHNEIQEVALLFSKKSIKWTFYFTILVSNHVLV